MADKNNNQIFRSHWYSSDLPPLLQTAVWISIIIVVALSILNLAGWIFDITFLKSIFVKWIPVKIIPASCFLLTATALVIIKVNAPVIIWKIFPGVVAILVGLLSLATLYIYIYHIRTGDESSLSGVPYLTFFFASGSGMSFFEACIFFSLGSIIFLLMAGKPKTLNLAHFLIIPIALVSYFIPVSYLLGVYSVTELINIPEALTTGIAFCGICAVVLLIKPDAWFLKLFTARDTGGIIARKLLLPLMILPIVIAWLRINGERAGMFNSNEGIVLVALTYTSCFLVLIWLTARSVNKIDLKRHTSEKALQSTKDYLENLINYANAPIIVWNPDTRIQLFNHAFEHLTGYSSSEVEGKMLDMLFPEPSLEESNAKIKDALTENWKTIEIPILTKNGEVRTVLWNSANIYDIDKKTVLSTIAQGNDITERINAEQKVKERTKDLELANLKLKQELTERFQAQQALRKSEVQLKELNATKDKFFNIVAHDLKNPFTSLIGSSELLSKNIDQLDNEKIRNLATILNDSAKSGYAILQNLLDWSRSQTGMMKFNPERINLRKLIDENILNQELLSANKEIELLSEVKEDIIIIADKNMINTVLRNILSNALKFTYSYGKVVVSAEVDSEDTIISVKDNGIGISKENIDKLFRIDTKYSMPGTNNELGTGLGLKLSREFVEKHGGRIWVESIENKGSEFKFSIPQMKNFSLMK